MPSPIEGPIKYLSLFSGIEAASVAWEPLGYKAMAFADIEKFPSEVLAQRFPEVPNLGDVTAIDWEKWKDENGSPDVMVAGSPCQAFSVAGKRRSLEDARGNLSLFTAELVRYLEPRVFLWENVPGVLNTKDNAFGCLLGELVGADAPLVPNGRWSNSGVVAGPERRLAWRVLDAQWFGVAQRRRRVFVVACPLDGPDPVSILLEPEGLRRHTPPSREPREGTATSTEICVGSSSGEPHGTTVLRDQGGSVMNIEHDMTGTLRRETKGHEPIVLDRAAFNQGQNAQYKPYIEETETMPSLVARGPHAVCMSTGQANAEIVNEHAPTLSCNHEAPIVMAPAFSKRPGQQIANRQDDISYAITTGEPPRVLDRASFNQGQNAKYELLGCDVYNGAITGDVAATLTAASGEANTSGPKVLSETPDAVCIQGSMIGRSDTAGPQGTGVNDDLCFTLNTTDRHAVSIQDCVRTEKQQNGVEVSEEDTAYTLDTTGSQGIGSAGTVRRLTPLECERLQGFPDNWTQISWRGKSPEDCPDGPRYKACGNSMAVPVMRWLGARIAVELTGAGHSCGIPEAFRDEVESR